MRVSDNMLWSLPFIHAAGELVPLEKIKDVTGYSLRRPQTAWATPDFAVCVKHGKKYAVRIRLTGWEDSQEKKPVQRPLYTAVVLDSLAHELAHIVHWEHTPQHLALQSDLMKRFAIVAEREGVQDTYDRLGRKRK